MVPSADGGCVMCEHCGEQPAVWYAETVGEEISVGECCADLFDAAWLERI